MASVAGRAFVLDTNCYVNASRSAPDRAALDEFCARAAPRLWLSTIVAAELRAGASEARARRTLEANVLAPFVRRGRLLNPSARAWQALGTTLSTLVAKEGLVLRQVRRSFVFDILLAWSCREMGATLVSANTSDLTRIARVFRFDFVPPYPG